VIGQDGVDWRDVITASVTAAATAASLHVHPGATAAADMREAHSSKYLLLRRRYLLDNNSAL